MNVRVIRVGNAYEPPEARAWRAMFPAQCVTERELRAATRWTPAEWGRDRSGDWATAVRIGEPVKAGAKRNGAGGRSADNGNDAQRGSNPSTILPASAK